MLSVFFNGTGQFLIDILREGKLREGRVMLHFDNAPIHCTGTIRDRMADAELERMEHPSYSPDLASYDFFLFGYIKGKLMGKQYETPEDLVSEVRNIIEAIRPDVLKSVFKSWKGRLLDC
jgi:transposase